MRIGKYPRQNSLVPVADAPQFRGMNSTSLLPALIPLLLPRLPFLLVCLAGVVVGLTQLHAHRKPAALVLIGSALLGLSFATSLATTVVSFQRAQSGGSPAELGALFGVLGVVQGLLSAAGYGFLIGAAFVGRNPPPLKSS